MLDHLTARADQLSALHERILRWLRGSAGPLIELRTEHAVSVALSRPGRLLLNILVFLVVDDETPTGRQSKILDDDRQYLLKMLRVYWLIEVVGVRVRATMKASPGGAWPRKAFSF
ncbi:MULTISPECIES: hypothetical protein [Burkholderia]|uniref:hypothetical protein n=1 Tax=Burkholderia sp. MSMB175 TaxID=1086510 RepID=UPI0008422BFD|nr:MULTISPECIES: hypothetical protein [unclassified Burkholderia]AOK29703.1 hypothetical protein AQ611_09960 [Burkholderia sp. Bp7605]